MENRQKIHQEHKFYMYTWSDTEPRMIWKDLIAVKGLEPGDIIEDIRRERETRERGGWGFQEDESISYTAHNIAVVVKRWRDETDEEYLARMRRETTAKKIIDEREKLEFLRLKAKFEKDE